MDHLDQDTIDLAKQLIAKKSVSPEDGGCQQMIGDYLSNLGFRVESMRFDDVDNLWAVRGEGGPRLVFAGHTDVVPPGPIEDWSTPPFEPRIIGDVLHGRGAADMKGSLAAMLTATRRFVDSHPGHAGSLGFLITSDEEDEAINGTSKVIEALTARREDITWCVVGEPSSDAELGDTIRIGRRGTLGARLIIKGVQGHVAYPLDARNPIHLGIPALAELVSEVWDEGNTHFPATSLQFSNIRAGTGANNVIPGRMDAWFNFRYSTESTADSLKQRTLAILDRHALDYEIRWSTAGLPFLTTRSTLIDAVRGAIADVVGRKTRLSTSGGTSDGRFIAPTGAEVVELGPCNATIHKIDECVRVDDLVQLSKVYTAIMAGLLCGNE